MSQQGRLHTRPMMVAWCIAVQLGAALQAGAADHPRILLSADDIPALRQQANSTHRELWQPVLAFAEQNAELIPSETSPDAPKGMLFREAADSLLPFAFAYLITGEPRYLDLTRRCLLAYAEWEHWGDDIRLGDLRVAYHHMLMFNAIAYDWISSDISAADRDAIATSLARRAQESYEASIAEETVQYAGSNWWRRSYIQNHHLICHSALGIAALVLQGEDRRADLWLKDSIDHMARSRFLLEGIVDGTWHESLPYQSYALSMSLPFLCALREVKETDIIPHTYYRSFVSWRVYNWLPGTDRFLLTYGDFNPDRGGVYRPPHLLRFAAGEYRDGHAEWMAREAARSAGRRVGAQWAPWYVLEFLWYDPSVAPRPPHDLPVSRTFPDLAAVIWRSGWGADDIAFGLKTGVCGGHFAHTKWIDGEYPFDEPGLDGFAAGHDHQDANTFYLCRGGVDLASEVSREGGSGTALHNTVLIDGEGQYRAPPEWHGYEYWDEDPRVFQGIGGRLESVCGTKRFHYLVADATDCYRHRDEITGRPADRMVDEYRRRVLFAAPTHFVMVDSLSADAPHRYDWVCHFGSSVAVEDGWIRGTTEDGNILGVRVVAPAAFGWDLGDDGKPHVRVRPPAPVENTQFVTVFYPTNAAGWGNRPRVSALSVDEDAAAVRVEIDGISDHLIRLRRDATGALNAAGYSFDGEAASVIRDARGELKRVFLAHGTELSDSDGSRLLLRGKTPDLVVEVAYDLPSVAIYGEGLDGVKVYAPGADASQVTVNDTPASAAVEGEYICLGV